MFDYPLLHTHTRPSWESEASAFIGFSLMVTWSHTLVRPPTHWLTASLVTGLAQPCISLPHTHTAITGKCGHWSLAASCSSQPLHYSLHTGSSGSHFSSASHWLVLAIIELSLLPHHLSHQATPGLSHTEFTIASISWGCLMASHTLSQLVTGWLVPHILGYHTLIITWAAYT